MNNILMHGHQLAGPFLDAVDLLGTFVFALSGAAAGVKSRFDLFGLMALSFAAGNAGAGEAFLEARPSNTSAIRLYQSLGFTQIGMRRGYYQATDGREDAIVLKRRID